MKDQWLKVLLISVGLGWLPGLYAMSAVDPLIQAARLKVNEGDLGEAAALYHQALQIEDLESPVRLELAKVLIEGQARDPYSESFEELEAVQNNVRAGRSQDFSTSFLNNVPLEHTQKHLERQALIILNKIKNDDNQVAFKLANVFQQKNPSHSTPYNLLGLAYRGKGELKKAVDLFSEAIQRKADFHAARLNRAEIKLHLGALDEARDDLNAVLAFDKTNRRACLVMARLCMLEQKTALAEEWYAKASERY